MSNSEFHDYLRAAFRTMKRNEVAFLKISEKMHRGIYHHKMLKLESNSMIKKRTKEELEKIRDHVGQDIYIKVTLTQIQRDPRCDANGATFKQRVDFFNTVRDTCKELTSVGEWSNAKTLYQRCIGIFTNIPKKIKDVCTEEEMS